MAKKILTLNIGAANIELAEYEAGAKGALTLVAYGVAPLAASLEGGEVGTILTPALMNLAHETGIKAGPVAVSISGQMVFPKFASIAAAGGEEKFEQMIRMEIEQNIPFPIDEMVCDRQVLGDTESGEKSVMIVAAKVDQVEALTAAVAAAGFAPTLVDVAPIALVNAAKASVPDDGACDILLDIGAKTTTLVISEGDKLYNRSISIAGNALTKEIATALGCTAEEAEAAKLEHAYVSLGGVTEDEDEATERIAKACRAVATRLNAEISRSINFYRSQQHGQPPSKLYLTGGSALLPQLADFFAESLGIDVEFFNPFTFVGIGPKVDATALESDAAQLAVTAGVALHEAGQARFTVNLLPPSIVAARAEKAKIPVIAAGGVALVAALAALAFGLSHEATVAEAQRTAAEGRLNGLQAESKKVEAALGGFAATEAEAEALGRLLTARAGGVQRLGAVRDAIQVVSRDGMWIHAWEDGKVTIRYWKDRVRGTGGKTAGELFVDALKRSAAVEPTRVKISDMTALGKDAQVEQFTVEVAFK